MNIKEELLDLKSLKDQTRGADLFYNVCSAVDYMKLPLSKFSETITDGEPDIAGEQSELFTGMKEATLLSFIASFISKSFVPSIYHLLMT